MEDRRILERHSAIDFAREARKIGKEFEEGFELVAQIDRPAVSIFGSARVREGSAPYEAARAVARSFAEAGWAVVTGGGPGVMEAANRGARKAAGSRSASTSTSRTSRASTRTSTSSTPSSTSTRARRCS